MLAMSIVAANVLPDFSHRQHLVADDLRRLDEPCVLFEHKGCDSDGVDFYLYSVAGVLDGVRLGDGCTVGGEVILIHARDREEADALASMGLMDTINLLDAEADAYVEAAVAMDRLRSVGAKARLDEALKPDAERSDAFTADISKVRKLGGDDVVLTVGTVASGPH